MFDQDQTQRLVSQLRNEGYTDQEISNAMNQSQLNYQESNPYQYAMNQSSSSFANSQYNQNLIQYQLEPDDVFEKLEHFLRGDDLVYENKNLIWKTPKSNFDRRLSDKGVKSVMQIIKIYVNRNSILSDFDEETIRWKVLDFGKEVNRYFSFKYEEIFAIPTMEECFQRVYDTDYKLIEKEDYLDFEIEATDEFNRDGSPKRYKLSKEQYIKVKAEHEKWMADKLKEYRMILMELVDTLFATYRRALFGGERQSLREVRTVTENLQPNQQMNMGMQQPVMREKFSFFKPRSWFGQR